MVAIIIAYTVFALIAAYALTDTREPESGFPYVLLAITPTVCTKLPAAYSEPLVALFLAIGSLVLTADLWYTYIYKPRLVRG